MSTPTPTTQSAADAMVATTREAARRGEAGRARVEREARLHSLQRTGVGARQAGADSGAGSSGTNTTSTGSSGTGTTSLGSSAQSTARGGVTSRAGLAALGSVSGKVSGADGVSTNTVRVELSRNGNDWVYASSTTADGTYQLPSVSPGVYFVRFRRLDPTTDYLQTWLRSGTSIRAIRVGDGQAVTGVNVTMELGRTVSGVVQAPPDTESSNEPGVIYVALHGADGSSAGFTTTSANQGAFSLHAVKPGTYTLSFAGYGRADVRPTSQVVTVGATDVTKQVALTPGGRVNGTVLDTNGNPAPNQLVCFEGDHATCDLTDTTGVYDISSLPAGQGQVSLVDVESSFDDATYYPGVPRPSQGASVSVVAGQNVSLGSTRYPARATVSGMVSGAADPFVSLVDADGRIVSGGYGSSYTVSAPPTTVKVYAGDYAGPRVGRWWNGASTRAAASSLALRSGTTTAGVNLGLSSAGEAVVMGKAPTYLTTRHRGLHVTAISAEGDFVKGADVRDATDFTLTGLAAGRYTLIISDESQIFDCEATVTVAAGQTVSVVTWQWPASSYRDYVQLGTPTISGSPVVNGTLTGALGSWVPNGSTYKLQWLANGVPIAGASSSRLVVPEAAAFKRISLRVSASQYLHRTATRTSATTAAVPGYFAAPRPVIKGTRTAGRQLSASLGTWSPAASRYTYQWRRNGVAIAGATRSAYVLTSADRGRTITVSVTGQRAGHSNRTVTSYATARIA